MIWYSNRKWLASSKCGTLKIPCRIIYLILKRFRFLRNSEEAENLKKKGVNIIIALGHSGYLVDQEIARDCPLVDVVIGGHSNTFLYTGEQPDAEKIDGPYPTVVKQASGKEVPVVQAYAYTKYLGELKLSVSQFSHESTLYPYLYILVSLFFRSSSMPMVICWHGQVNRFWSTDR